MKLYQKIAQTFQAIQNCEKSGNNEWYEKHNETLRYLENEYLPHGSGFDGDMGIFEGNTKKFIIRFDWHCMNDMGYYNGWLTIDCIVTANLTNGFDLKISFYKSELQNDKAKVKKYKPLIEDFFYDEFNNILSQDYKESKIKNGNILEMALNSSKYDQILNSNTHEVKK